MFSRIFYFCLLFTTAAVDTPAQSTYNFKLITVRDGLSDGRISDFAQDKYGKMWISGYGLDRYDGYKVEHYIADPDDSTSLPDMNIRKLLCTRRGNLYVSTFSGFCRYNYVNNNFERLPFGINAGNSRMLETEDGILWMNSTKGLVIVNENNSTVQELAKHPDTLIRKVAKVRSSDFAADKNGNVYLATRIGFFIINYKTWQVTHYTHDDNNPASIISNDVQNVVIDHDGIAWLSTGYYGASLERFDPRTKKFTHYSQLHSKKKEWADNRILDLMVDSKNRLWIGSVRGSLALYNREKNDFDFFLYDPLQSASVSSHTVYSLFQDREGAIWLSSLGSGADYFFPDNNSFNTISASSFHSPALVDNWCQSVAEDKNGNLWIGTYRGLSFFNRQANKFTNYFLAQQETMEANNSIRSVLADEDGTIWIGTGTGLNRWHPDRKKIEPVNTADSIPPVFINYLIMDKQKRLLVCSPSGLFRYNRAKKKFEDLLKQPALAAYQNQSVFSVYQDSKGRYWISFSLRGVLVYDEDKKTAEFFKLKFLNPRSLPYDFITSFAEDTDGVMWLSSYYGLISFNYEKKKLNQYYYNNGLSSNKTSELLVDSLNRIWIGTANGLCMLDAERKKFHLFDAKDGLTNSLFYEGSAYKLSKGYFAYPTYGGLLLFRPQEVNFSETKVSVSVASLKVSGEKFKTGVPAQELKKIRLKYDQNFFSIEMTGLNYSAPQKTAYAYKLEGFNEDWIYTNERIVNYTNVPGGKYVFKYKATGNASDWNVAEHQLEIFIGTVFYKTWWFLSLAVLLLASLVYLFVRFRFMQQKRVHSLENRAQSLEKEKALVMYENLKQHLNPHFLFNSLTSLRSLIRVDQKHAGDFLERMSKIYRYILKSRDSELVQLKDEINFVQTYIELQQTRFREGLQVKFNINDEHLHLKIVPVTLQNLIDNAIKHNLVDEETPLIVEIFVEENYLVVRNNLQKKEFVETSNKQGLQNMRSLYHYLDSRPVIINEDQNYFTIKIPLI